jgi:hypothetical protein
MLMAHAETNDAWWPASDSDLFLVLLRATYTAVCERLDIVDQEDNVEPLVLSNMADELATGISHYETRREATQ